MNKALTDGILFMPTTFSEGLDVWSSGDGTPGSDTYDQSGGGVYVPSDQDFGGCMEVIKSNSTTPVRYMAETPILPGCFLRVTVRVKVISGNLPNVRIAGWAGGSGGSNVTSVTQHASATSITSYGDVYEVSAIIATADRTGVDMVWGDDVLYGHLGLDLTGANGGVIRIDDIEIHDVSSEFRESLIGAVDVRDYGAVGDGSTDCADAFEAADAAANGREVLVPDGIYFLGSSVTFENRVRFIGTVTMDQSHRLTLRKDFNLPSYIDAFGDEEQAFRKALQVLLNYSDHESLDMGGRIVSLTAPIDVQAEVSNQTSFETRRVVRNGQLYASNSTAWDTDVFTSQATYDPSNPKVMTDVMNIANIPKGSLIEGTGVGREIYVTDVNIGAQTLSISAPLHDAEGTQAFTFTRFKYMLDFSGFAKCSKFNIDDMEIHGNGNASGILLAPAGNNFHIRDCYINKPKDRGITSPGRGCQDLLIDRCQFISNENALPVSDRTTIAMNANANDVKLRDSRFQLFKHTCVLGGVNSVVVGNHWFQGDSEDDGVRGGGIIFTTANVLSIITGNYIDNNFIEWTNEHDSTPDLQPEYSFGALTVTGNTFVVKNVASWFKWFVVKPYGSGHFINGLSVTGNVFRTVGSTVDRIDGVDTSYADLDYTRIRNIDFSANTFNGVSQAVYNPVRYAHTQSTASKTWMLDVGAYLPFGGRARNVDSVVANGDITNASNATIWEFPNVDTAVGSDNDQVQLNWNTAVKGKVTVSVRMDNPL